jgi:t-SNARE complex subunit (syntaxin)
LPREVDPKKTRKALRRLAKTRRKVADAKSEDTLSEWEDEFIASVEDRLETYGSAFNDPDKGKLDDALSGLQAAKLREIEKKADGKGRKPMSRGKGFKQSSFRSKSKSPGPRVRDINEDIEADATDPPQPPRPDGPPKLRVIKGREDDA